MAVQEEGKMLTDEVLCCILEVDFGVMTRPRCTVLKWENVTYCKTGLCNVD